MTATPSSKTEDSQPSGQFRVDLGLGLGIGLPTLLIGVPAFLLALHALRKKRVS
jgi:hypothetical protein